MKKLGFRAFRGILAIILCFALVFPFSVVPAEAVELKAAQGGIDYIISNPYESVDWGSSTAFKAQLHCHTNASDGSLTVKQVVQESYELSYDILSITDHGVLNRGWNAEPQLIPLARLVKYERTKMADIIPLSDEEYNYYLNGTDRDGRGMLDVPLGIELNFATPVADCHLTGYFSEYGQSLAGVYGDYETPAAGVKAAGGISMLSHLGEYTCAEEDASKSSLTKNVNKFANIFLNNAGSCVGMGINSGKDNRTFNDRILYDNIIKKTIPYGVVPWCFTFSDAHSQGEYDRAFTMHMMESNTLENFRESMEKGTFFSISRHAIYEMGNEFEGNGPVPMVTNISVNNDNGTITVEGENFNNIVWIADGDTVSQGNTTLNLYDFGRIKRFVRFYLTGPGGICYSQPFAINIDGVEMVKENIPPTHDISTFLRAIVTLLDDLIFKHSIIVKLFKQYLLGYQF